MYKIKYSKYITFYKIFIIFILISIIIYILYKYYYNIINKNNKEHYLTYFLPYYKRDIYPLTKFYLNNDNNLNYFKKKMDYNTVKMGIIKIETDYELNFARFLLSSYLATSNLVKAEIYSLENRIKSMDDLVNNNINFLLTEFETYLYYKNNLKKNTDNIRFVCHLYKLYYYIFTLKKYNISSILTFPAGCNIGFLKSSETILFFYIKFLKDLGYENNIDYHIKVYDTIDDLFNGLFKGDIHIILIRTIYPQDDISRILDNKMNEGIILLPFDLDKDNVFFQKTKSVLFLDSIDLNFVSASYLPIKFGNNQYTNFKPDMNLCAGYKIMLTNVQTAKEYTFNFIEYLYKNYKYLNSIVQHKGNIIPPVYDYYGSSTLIDYHKGVEDFLYKYGFFTNEDNPNCKFLVGVMPCTHETLKNNNLLYSS